MMRPIHNVVSGVQGLLWTPKVLGRLPLFGGTVATRKWSPFRSPAFGRVSTIAARFRCRSTNPTAPSTGGNAGGDDVTRSAARARNLIDTGGEALVGWHGGAGSARPISPPLVAHLLPIAARHHKLIAALAMVAIWAAWALATLRLK